MFLYKKTMTSTETKECFLTLNVGGKVFLTTNTTLNKYKKSYFADLPKNSINRDYEYFNIILNYLRMSVANIKALLNRINKRQN